MKMRKNLRILKRSVSPQIN